MIIEKTALPQNSILNTEKDFQFIDGYKTCFEDEKDEMDIEKIGKLFFSAGPKWIDVLFTWRNKIALLFGLKISGNYSDRKKQVENFKCELGEQIGLFKVFYKSDSELVLGEDDKHLDFRVSLFLQREIPRSKEKQLIISTAVKFNNTLGKLYFVAVKPFHKLIVPAMLKGIITHMNNEKAISGDGKK